MSQAPLAKIKAAREVKGGPEGYDHESEHKVEAVLAVRYEKDDIVFYVTWQGYDHTFGTWERAKNLLDKSVVTKFFSFWPNGIDMAQVFHELRTAVYTRVRSARFPEAGVTVEVPLAALRPVAHALLHWFRRVPSRAGMEPLEVKKKQSSGKKTLELTIDGLNDIASTLLLQTVAPTTAFGALVYGCGRTSNRDMPFCGPSMVLKYQEPTPRADGAFKAGVHKFTITLNLWIVHGHNGDVAGEAGMPNATCKGPIVEHVKNVLRGRAAWGLQHPLQEEWAQLPPSQPVLAGAVRFAPEPTRKRARAPASGAPQMADLA